MTLTRNTKIWFNPVHLLPSMFNLIALVLTKLTLSLAFRLVAPSSFRFWLESSVSVQGSMSVSGLGRRCRQVSGTQCGLALQTSLVQSLRLSLLSPLVSTIILLILWLQVGNGSALWILNLCKWLISISGCVQIGGCVNCVLDQNEWQRDAFS